MGRKGGRLLINCEYLKPVDLQEALKFASQFADRARFAAGCTNILPDIHTGKLRDCVLIDISDLKELTGINREDDFISLGSATTVAELLNSEIIRNEAPVLWEAASRFADPVVRNRATVGGNLAYGSPASDMSVPLLVLDATVLVQSMEKGIREIPLRNFFVGPGKTVLSPSEVILRIKFEPLSDFKFYYTKFGKRNAMAISIASLAVGIKLGKAIEEARIALGALAPIPLRALRTEEFLTGKPVQTEILEKASEILLSEINPISDIRGSKEYRLELTRALFLRAVNNILSLK